MTAHHRTVPPDAALDWQHHAACAAPHVDPGWFFPESAPGVNGSIAARRVARAKTVCGGCDVRRQCLTDALSDPHRYGIWGGLTEDERLRGGVA